MLSQRLSERLAGVLLGACATGFLDAAKPWSTLAAWMHGWVEAIGEVYHLNGQRLAVWQQSLPLVGQSPGFLTRQQALVDRLAEMAIQRDLGLADATLQPVQRKILNSLKNQWSGLTVFVDHRQTPTDNNLAENSLRKPATGRKNYYGSGAVWSAELAAMLFSILRTVILGGLNPRHWLTAFLTACADNGGQPLTELTPFRPWKMGAARLHELQQPRKRPVPENRRNAPPTPHEALLWP